MNPTVNVKVQGDLISIGEQWYKISFTNNGKAASVANSQEVIKQVAKILRESNVQGVNARIVLDAEGISAGTKGVNYDRRYDYIDRQIKGEKPSAKSTYELTKKRVEAWFQNTGSHKRYKSEKSYEKKDVKGIAGCVNSDEHALHHQTGRVFSWLGSYSEEMGTVFPTSRRGTPNDDHLTNAYFEGNVSRSGIIDTQTKMNEWLVGVTDRTLSLSLTGAGKTEHDMIVKQHKLMAAASVETKGQIAHIHTPANRGALLIQDHLHSLGGIGRWIDHTFVPGGEEFAREQNLAGLARLCIWAEFLPKGDGTDYNILLEKEDLIMKGKASNFQRKELRNALIRVYDSLKDSDPPKQVLLKKILGAGLGLEPAPSRGQEDLMLALFARMSGVHLAINCKSGLDRTGWLWAAVQALPKDNKQAFDLVMGWDKNTEEINTLVLIAAEGYIRKGKSQTEAWALAAQEFESTAYDTKRPAHLSCVMFQPFIEYRKRVYDILVSECLPMTAISTGLVGLKWGKGIKENLIPLNFIPPAVDGKSLVTYGPDGKPLGLTKKGHARLTQSAHLRSS